MTLSFFPMVLWKRNLVVLWIAQFITIMGMSLVVPFLPFFIRYLGVESDDLVSRWSGLVFAGPFLFSFFLTPVWGWLGDRKGQKPMVLRAIFGLALSQLLISFSSNVETLFVLRVVQGALSGFIPAALALVTTSSPREYSGYAIGVLSSSSSVGLVFGPLVGGALADLLGYRAIFILVSVLCAIAGVLVAQMVKEPPKTQIAQGRSFSFWDNYKYAFSTKAITRGIILILVSQMAFMIVQPVFPLFVEQLIYSDKMKSTLTGIAFSVTGVFMTLASPFWGSVNDKGHSRFSISLALAIASVSFLLQAFTSSYAALLVYRCFLGVSMGGILPALYTYVSKCADDDRKGSVTGIASSFNILANLLGPVVGGLLASTLMYQWNFVIASIMILGAFIFVSRILPSPMDLSGKSKSLSTEIVQIQ